MTISMNITVAVVLTIHISSSENINDVMVTGSFSLVVLLFSKGIITFTNDAKVELRLFFF